MQGHLPVIAPIQFPDCDMSPRVFAKFLKQVAHLNREYVDKSYTPGMRNRLTGVTQLPRADLLALCRHLASLPAPR